MCRVLIIEDDTTAFVVAKKILERCVEGKFDVIHHAPTLRAGSIALTQERYDVLVLDLNLPDSQGLDTLKAVKETYPSLPTIVYSGEDEIDVALESIKYGAETYLIKTNASLLPRLILYAVERRALIDRLATKCEEVARTNSYLNSILENVEAFICRYDTDGMIEYANERLCQEFNLDCYEILGRPFLDFIDPKYHAVALKQAACVSAQQPSITGSEILHTNGKFYQWRKAGIFDAQGKLIATQAYGKDRTKSVEYLEHRLEQTYDDSKELMKLADKMNTRASQMRARRDKDIKLLHGSANG